MYHVKTQYLQDTFYFYSSFLLLFYNPTDEYGKHLSSKDPKRNEKYRRRKMNFLPKEKNVDSYVYLIFITVRIEINQKVKFKTGVWILYTEFFFHLSLYETDSGRRPK